MKLYEHRLKDGLTAGIDINYSGPTTNALDLFTPPGYDGIHIIGKGEHRTTIRSDDWEASVMIGHEAGFVRISDCGIEEARSKAIYGGVTSAVQPTPRRLRLQVDNCFVGTGIRGRWVIFTNQTDIQLQNVEGRGWEFGEHFMYAHGVAEKGILWQHVKVDGAFSELFKVTGRPHGMYYIDQAKRARVTPKHTLIDGIHPVASGPVAAPSYAIEDSELTNFGMGKDTAGRGVGGGGVVIQGGGGHLRMRRTLISQAPGNRKGLAVALDDSGLEHFGRDPEDPSEWAAGEPPANMTADISECLFYCEPGSSWQSPMVRVGPLDMRASETVLERFKMEACGAFGQNRNVQMQLCDYIDMGHLNTPQIQNYAAYRGIDPTHEPTYNGTPLSQL